MFYMSDQKQKLLAIHEPRGYSLLFGWLRVPHVYKSNQKQKLLTIHEHRGYSMLFGWLVIVINTKVLLPRAMIGDLGLVWVFCLGPWVFLFSNTF
jgi:hypothetical protein